MAATILVADDSTTMRMIVESALAQRGWSVVTAGNGRDALARAQQAAPDLVVTDWNMPVMGGLDLVRGLRDNAATRAVPVLVLTTEEDQASKDAARGLGVSGWLNKPVDPEVLVDMVAELLEYAQVQDQARAR
jgi:Response regulator containing a CheY-like receiver domain and a GGDEF domain